MSKKLVTIFLIISIIFGSIVNFFATDCILGDVSNLTYGFSNRPVYVFASLPAFNLALIFVLFTIFLIRYLRRPQYLKRMSKLYVIIFMCFSFIGLVSAILSGIIVYNTFLAPNPFPGYLILSIVLFSIFLIAGSLFFILVYKKIKPDEEKRRIKVGYVFYSIILSCLTYYSFNRFGSFIWSHSFVDYPTLYLTWPFYFSLLLPIAMFIHTFLYSYNFYKKHNGAALAVISTIMGLFIITTLYTYLVGANNPKFISVISPAMGASRLLAKPIDFIANTVLFGLFGIYSLRHSIIYYKKHKVKEESHEN